MPEKFLLYVGAIEPGKNLSKLFKVLKKLQDCNNDLKTLVLTSGIGWDTDRLNELIVELNLEKNIIRLPYLKEEENYYFFTKLFYKGKLIFLKKHTSSKKFVIFKFLLQIHFINQAILWHVS